MQQKIRLGSRHPSYRRGHNREWPEPSSHPRSVACSHQPPCDHSAEKAWCVLKYFESFPHPGCNNARGIDKLQSNPMSFKD